jgi:cold shock CspA family protein
LGQILGSENDLKNPDRALTFLKQGARLGVIECHAELAAIFAANGHRENWQKCWTAYFDAVAGQLDRSSVGWYGMCYFSELRRFGLPMIHKTMAMKVRDETMATAQSLCEQFSQEKKEAAYFVEIELKTLEYHLFPETPRPRIQGCVKWFKNESGIISLTSGQDAFVHRQWIIDWPRTLSLVQEGRLVECETLRGPRGLTAFNVTLI